MCARVVQVIGSGTAAVGVHFCRFSTEEPLISKYERTRVCQAVPQAPNRPDYSIF
jgi:hypothetical protein